MDAPRFIIKVLANPIGKTVAAAIQVIASGPSDRRSIKPDSPIFSDDRLKPNATENAQKILIDITKIAVGPGADLQTTDIDNISSKFKLSRIG
ncbi:MAG: hypothetical protein GY742_00840 [Hyphomicrobiales bacterium]|nr:hypothetical protein [Hyphomicrobiales bacterium]